ncbi:MAG: chorismate-binding protein, partial [Burkholderiaceae bacterium]
MPHYGPSLGVLYLGETLYRRGSDGQWWRLQLSFPDLALPGPEAAAGGRPQDEDARAADTPARSAGTGSAARPPEPFAPPEWDDDFVPGGYARVVARAVQRLADATLVSLTLSQSFRRRVRMPPAQAFARLRAVNPAPVSFFVNTGDGECLFGASPDLQLRIAGRLVEAMPVCGTVARGAGAVGEAESFKALVNEEVDEASLAVCSDALRNDLAPCCEAGSLSLVDRRRQMSLSTVVHAVDRLRGRLRDGVSPWRAIFATAAPAMVTGTPRAAALRAIAELEAGPRRWYGGLMVQVA